MEQIKEVVGTALANRVLANGEGWIFKSCRQLSSGNPLYVLVRSSSSKPTDQPVAKTLEESIELKILHALGFWHIEELANLTEYDLKYLKGVSPAVIAFIRTSLESRGLTLRKE